MRPNPLSTGPFSRRVRLVAGLVLFAYVATHLIDHALGNASVAAMDAMLLVQKWVWQGVVGTVLLYGALTIHAGLGLWSLYARRYVGWTRVEVAQLVLGLSIPPLLVNHVTVTRVTLTLFGNDKAYPQELHALWLAVPAWGLVQLAVLIVAWSHACIGLSRAAALMSWYPRLRTALLAGAILVPVLAMLGFVQGVREEARIEAAQGWHPGPPRTDLPWQAARLAILRDEFLVAYALAVTAILAGRLVRRWHETERRGIAIRYPGGLLTRVPVGLSVLDASRMAGIAHASVCGGRGRCSTCRVRVAGTPAHLPEPSEAERRVLEWVGLDPALVRLACQLRPVGDIAVAPLVPPDMAGEYVAGRHQRIAGEERFVAALFVDMRDSTRLAETRMPYDSVFLVGRFVSVVARAVVEAGGVPNQFIGDGVFALFGLRTDDAQRCCREALDAVARVSAALAGLDAAASGEAGHAIQGGIGLHCGRAIVGEIGFDRHVTVTALGDVVNVAARLQGLTREMDCEAVVSEEVYAQAREPATVGEAKRVLVRGREGEMAVRLLAGSVRMRGASTAPL